MQAEKIFILDTNEENTTLFTDYLRQEDVGIEIFRDLNDILQKIPDDGFGLVLVNYEAIVEAERLEVIGMFKRLQRFYLIVYNVPDQANKRLAFYDLGASRVYDLTDSLSEICYRLKWLISSLSKSPDGNDHYSAGELEDIPLTTLIKIFGKENRNGVLKIVTPYNSGKLYFHNGNIDEAQVGYHKADKAVLHMLFWKNGSFSFNPAESSEPVGEIRTSNIGLSLLAEALRKEYVVNLEEIGPLSSVIRVKNTGDLHATDLNLIPEFVGYLERPHKLEELIENPYYTCYETADYLVRLKRLEFLIISEPTKLAIDEIDKPVDLEIDASELLELSSGEMSQLKTQLNLENQKSGKLIILGSHASGKTQFVRSLSNSKRAVKSEHGMDLGHLLMEKETDLLLVGVTIGEKAIETIQKLSEGVNGFIFLVDAEKPELFEYTNYLINFLTTTNEVPWTVAVTRYSQQETAEEVKAAFNFSVPADWQICDVKDLESIRSTLFTLKIHEMPEEKEEEDQTEEENTEAVTIEESENEVLEDSTETTQETSAEEEPEPEEFQAEQPDEEDAEKQDEDQESTKEQAS